LCNFVYHAHNVVFCVRFVKERKINTSFLGLLFSGEGTFSPSNRAKRMRGVESVKGEL